MQGVERCLICGALVQAQSALDVQSASMVLSRTMIWQDVCAKTFVPMCHKTQTMWDVAGYRPDFVLPTCLQDTPGMYCEGGNHEEQTHCAYSCVPHKSCVVLVTARATILHITFYSKSVIHIK